MRRKLYIQVLLLTVAIIAIGTVVTVGFIVANSQTNSSTAITTPQGLGATAVVITPTLAPTVGVPNLKVLTPTVAIGDIIKLPSGMDADLKLLRASVAPSLLPQEALDIVYDKGVPWGRGGQHKGKIVTITAAFGTATIGRPLPNGAWGGIQNIAVETCNAGKCTSTGQILDRIENRAMWILDYENLDSSDFLRQPAPCGVTIQCRIHNRSAFAVDVQTKSVLYAWSYAA